MTTSQPTGSEALVITPSDPADDEAIIALWTRAGLTRPWNDPARDIAFVRESGHGAILAGRVGSAIVAALMVGHDGHRGAVYYVAVDPECRHRGHGRALMAAAEHWLRAHGVWKLNLLVRSGNESAVRFYESLGYEVQPRIYLEKWLDPSLRPAR